MNVSAIVICAGESVKKEIGQVASFAEKNLSEGKKINFLALTDQKEIPAAVRAEKPGSFNYAVMPYSVDEEQLLEFIQKWSCSSHADLFVFGSSVLERNIAVKFAGLTKRTVVTNVKEMEEEQGRLFLVRDVYLGNLEERILLEKNMVCTLAGNSPVTCQKEYRPKWEEIFFEGRKASCVLKTDIEPKNVSAGWETAPNIIVVGNGVDKEGFLLVEAFAKKIHAQIAGTRRAAENGLIPAERMIGISGKSIAPRTCIIFGASGLAAFTKGIEKSKIILSVNTDPDALIFKYSDYGVIQDYKDFIREYMIE